MTPIPNNLEKILNSMQLRSEEHTSELQSRGLISYAVFCLKKKTKKQKKTKTKTTTKTTTTTKTNDKQRDKKSKQLTNMDHTQT